MMEMKVTPKVLIFNIGDDGRGKRIKGYLREKNIASADILPSQFKEPLGALLELPGFSGKGSISLERGFTDEMLVMFGFTSEMMDAFLKFFRDENIRPVALKAAVTPVNINWDPAKLHSELLREHNAFEGNRKDKR